MAAGLKSESNTFDPFSFLLYLHPHSYYRIPIEHVVVKPYKILKHRIAVILLAFVLALGFLLVILSCALWLNWYPLFVGEYPNSPRNSKLNR
jgi:hypothetical protein